MRKATISERECDAYARVMVAIVVIVVMMPVMVMPVREIMRSWRSVRDCQGLCLSCREAESEYNGE